MLCSFFQNKKPVFLHAEEPGVFENTKSHSRTKPLAKDEAKFF
jgi:hypothetical protein